MDGKEGLCSGPWAWPRLLYALLLYRNDCRMLTLNIYMTCRGWSNSIIFLSTFFSKDLQGRINHFEKANLGTWTLVAVSMDWMSIEEMSHIKQWVIMLALKQEHLQNMTLSSWTGHVKYLYWLLWQQQPCCHKGVRMCIYMTSRWYIIFLRQFDTSHTLSEHLYTHSVLWFNSLQ